MLLILFALVAAAVAVMVASSADLPPAVAAHTLLWAVAFHVAFRRPR